MKIRVLILCPHRVAPNGTVILLPGTTGIERKVQYVPVVVQYTNVLIHTYLYEGTYHTCIYSTVS